MSSTAPELKPLLVSVKQARTMLGGISNNLFWRYVRDFDLELTGTYRKRWVVVESIERAVEKMRKQAEPQGDR
jgi:hypothetical protein